MKNKKVGFFGGCFNPPTIAHINLAKKAMEVANLDEIVFVPMGNCYPKENLIDIKFRYEMLEIATKNIKNFSVSNMQENQNKKSYAIDSFKTIDKNYNCEKFFIMGDDNFIKINNWKDYDELKKYKFIVFERDKKIKKNDNVIVVENNNYKNITSSKVRQEIINNTYDENVLPNGVLKYIQEKKLYK